MGGNKPKHIITDQDPAMKIAIERIFDSSRHRFYLWHIMKKVSEKVGASLNSNDEFNSSFKSCIWSSETPEEFEATWNSIMIKFELQKNDQLSHMYDNRSMWIPAYFKNIFLGGILRTTSISESENSFYLNFMNSKIGLVESWMRFESAIQSQRHKEVLADNASLHSQPILKLDCDLEKHGRDIYTREIFYTFQKESWIACAKEIESSFIGRNLLKEVEIHPPQISKTKGSGKRIKGGKEVAIEQQGKRTRLCKSCGQYAYHDSRNCLTTSTP